MKKYTGFGDRLKELRQKKNISQTELGKLVNLHYTHISRYERELSQPTADKLRKLGEFFGVTTDYLIEGKINEVAKGKLEDKDLLEMFQEIQTFEEEDKFVLKKLIDAFIAKKKIQQISNRR